MIWRGELIISWFALLNILATIVSSFSVLRKFVIIFLQKESAYRMHDEERATNDGVHFLKTTKT